MIKITKRKQILIKKINLNQEYNIKKAIKILKKYQTNNFVESIDVSMNLGIDPKKTEQTIRGATILPHGLGKKIKIAVFTQGKNIEIAKQYGADIAGSLDIVSILKNKKNSFDVIIASPDTMHIVSTLGPILGPRGLMPNIKTGTITEDIKTAVKNAKKGNIRYKNDKNGIIHTTIGKINFTDDQIYDNLKTLITEIKKLKPKNSKGNFIKKLILSSTMGCGIIIDLNSVI
ncbi:50S ribosomal protein L1 [Buchnera aphidicola (Takecallis arundicolens)]|uniref:50S ribosomal protein L1 n=1 Tax=Buchnera aphidicola TaxID=9 RepID=UPI003464D546